MKKSLREGLCFVGWIHYQCQLNTQLLCIDLERVVLVVNEVISRSLECVGAEVQCLGVGVVQGRCARKSTKGADGKKLKTCAQTVLETESGG
jgi:hypothetical protein